MFKSAGMHNGFSPPSESSRHISEREGTCIQQVVKVMKLRFAAWAEVSCVQITA